MDNQPPQPVNPTPIVSEQNPVGTPPPSGSFPTVIIVVVLIVILALLGTGAYYYLGRRANPGKPVISTGTNSPPAGAPTTQPTADWKTYTSYGFTFKMPSSWAMQQENDQTTTLYNPASALKKTYASGTTSTIYKEAISISTKQSSSTPIEEVDSIQKNQSSPPFLRKSITINNQPAEAYYIEGEAVTGWYVVLSNKTSLLQIGPLASVEGKTTSDQILQTFRFD